MGRCQSKEPKNFGESGGEKGRGSGSEGGGGGGEGGVTAERFLASGDKGATLANSDPTGPPGLNAQKCEGRGPCVQPRVLNSNLVRLQTLVA